MSSNFSWNSPLNVLNVPAGELLVSPSRIGFSESVPFIVDVDDSYGAPAERTRIGIDQDNLEYYRVEQDDVYDTIRTLYSGTTVGYSHRGGGRQPIPIRMALPKGEKRVDERTLATPVPANVLPGDRAVVELGDVVSVTLERASYPIFRHNGRAAEMVTAELAGAYEAPIYGMIAVAKLIDTTDWGNLPKPEIALHGQPDDESHPTLLWDGEWEVTWVTFRDMGAASTRMPIEKISANRLTRFSV